MSFNSDDELEFVDDDGQLIKAGPELVTYVDEKGIHVPDAKAIKAITSGSYIDNRTLYSKRAAKKYQKAPPKPSRANLPKKQAEYVKPDPNQTRDLIANMHDMFAKARSNLKEMPDLGMIEEDASGYNSRSAEKSNQKPPVSYKPSENESYKQKTQRSKSQINTQAYAKSSSKVNPAYNNSTRSQSRSRSQKAQPTYADVYATAYNPYTGQYYQYKVEEEQEEEQPRTRKHKSKSSRVAKEAELDARIARLQNKLSSTTLNGSVKNRSVQSRVGRGELSAASPQMEERPIDVTIDPTTTSYHMHHYSGIPDPRTNLLKAEMLSRESRERRMEQQNRTGYMDYSQQRVYQPGHNYYPY